MSKSSKSKKSKVPKLTEAEYAEYISSLKGENIPLPPPSTAGPIEGSKKESAPMQSEVR